MQRTYPYKEGEGCELCWVRGGVAQTQQAAGRLSEGEAWTTEVARHLRPRQMTGVAARWERAESQELLLQATLHQEQLC